MKLHLLLPTKWKSLDRRVADLQDYLSARYKSIYGSVTITYEIVTLPKLTLNSHGVYNKSDILKITKPYHTSYDAVGIIFPRVKTEKYFGNYYANDGTEYKMDFYVKSDERNRDINEQMEDMVEHEMAHAVALDLGLSQQNTSTGYVAGADNTHYYFYNNKKDEFYKEVQEQWKKKFGILSSILTSMSQLLEQLIGKKKIKPLEDKYWKNVTQGYAIKNPIYSITGYHIGVDFGCPVGTPIYAREDGAITKSGYHSELGNFLYFKFKGYEERYCHLQRIVRERTVKKGDIIGYTGNTGMSSGSHLHLDTWKNKVGDVRYWREQTVNPLSI